MRVITFPKDRGAISSRNAPWQNSAVLISDFSDAFSDISEISYAIDLLVHGSFQMHRRVDDKDGGRKPRQANPTVSGPPSGHAVITFPRRANIPPRCPAASSSYSAEELDAFFTPIGEAMSAVVLRIRNSCIRIQATVPAMEEER